MFIKPARLGSSVGITKARSPEELRAGLDLAFRHDEKVLVEEFVDGVEVECSVLGNLEPVASIPGEIVANADWYDYSAKYDEGGMELIVPPRISPEASERVQELSVAAFRATECEGMARADCFVRADGEVLVNELNTIPGLHGDERVREALRGFWRPLRGVAREADRARAGAARAPLTPQVLAVTS